MTRIPTAVILLAVLLAASASAGPKQVQLKPLGDVVTAQVRGCEGKTSVSLPIITWGGDIATIYANGNQVDTKEGSIFAEKGLRLKLFREDVFPRQVEKYLSCDTPYLRGTLGMINLATDAANRDPRTKPVVIYQHTYSAGGDTLVVKSNIKRPEQLKGKTISLQAYGPHLEYLDRILAGAGLSFKDVKIRWTKDLTGTEETPVAAFHEASVDAAMVITPDALALTSGGKTGTGSENSVKGARILLSTKTADHVIADVYAVRADYLGNHREEVANLVQGLMLAEEATAKLFRNKGAGYSETLRSSAQILLDSADALSDTEGLYFDCRYVGWKGNVKFFADKNNPRNFERMTADIQKGLSGLGMISGRSVLENAKWDYNKFKPGLADTANVEAPKFDAGKVAKAVTKRQQSEEGVLFSFEIYFKPNQNTFPLELYKNEFHKVIEYATTYGGAIITVEGHSDPLEYLKKKKSGTVELVLRQIKQSAKNLSLSRANQVRQNIIDYSKSRGIVLDESQFAVVGHGIMSPVGGTCGEDPCAPKNEKEWLSNMRVVFKILQVEGEAVQFEAL
jgi:ABC-type nitrate/sulfonate/bicarbonate transport system substrate-binding protein